MNPHFRKGGKSKHGAGHLWVMAGYTEGGGGEGGGEAAGGADRVGSAATGGAEKGEYYPFDVEIRSSA